MPFNIHRAGGLRALCPALLVAVIARGVEAQACPSQSGAASEAGWAAYRAGRTDEALDRFIEAERHCASNLDAVNGRGYVALRRGEAARADSIFAVVLGRDSSNSDGWTGVALTARRLGDGGRARMAALRAVRIDPGNASARAVLEAIDPDWNRAPSPRPIRPRALELTARTVGERFEIRPPGGDWRRIWIKGVNLGVALPGRFPSEFPQDSSLYAGWIDTIASMNANAVRVYTILPPSFYRALLAWNSAHPDRALWLVHGVWTELPPEYDFDDEPWRDEFRAAMRSVVDVVHGSATLPARPGHASGRYDADLSRWTLAYIIGREWEPYAIKAFQSTRPGRRAYHGRFLEGDALTAADHWMAEACDYMLGYEHDRYNALRPIAYTNWPTLDPLRHPTEANADEEREWRRRSGREAASAPLEYENDAVTLDASLVRPTRANPAGWFASYHAYPYYPDFMIHDPAYNRAESSEGRSNYFGYLRELRRHHAGLPLLIAEYGVPSSRGNAHLQPQGWDHGGHDERTMAEIDARLTRDLHEAGTAGGIVFAWLDEWFKRNWLVLDFEIPAENTRRWHNVMDAEQNYGILGMRSGSVGSRPTPGGDPRRWISGDTEILITADASYVYLGVRLSDGFRWATHGIEIGIDTYLESTGQHRLPRTGMRSTTGFEFLVDLPHPDSGSMRALPEYNRHAAPYSSGSDDLGRFLRRPITIVNRDDGRFDRMLVTTNRARFGRDGRFFPARSVDRGVLTFGKESDTSLADWYYDERAGIVEVRIPWDLLNVSDPSTRTLIFDKAAHGPIGTAPATQFHFEAVVYRRDRQTPPRVIRSGAWQWEGWTEPVWHARLKPAFAALRAAWGDIR